MDMPNTARLYSGTRQVKPYRLVLPLLLHLTYRDNDQETSHITARVFLTRQIATRRTCQAGNSSLVPVLAPLLLNILQQRSSAVAPMESVGCTAQSRHAASAWKHGYKKNKSRLKRWELLPREER